MTRQLVSRAAACSIVVAAVVGLSGCTSATEPAGPVTPGIHNVAISFESIEVIGSCDHNSIFESARDGEFDFVITVRKARDTPVEYRKELSATLTEGTHLMASAATTVRRDLAETTGIRIDFWVSERDGLLGNDGDMSNRNGSRTHQWTGDSWSGTRAINVTDSADCGVSIGYTITSKPVS